LIPTFRKKAIEEIVVQRTSVPSEANSQRLALEGLCGRPSIKIPFLNSAFLGATSRGSADVRSAAHNRLNSDIAPCPKSAMTDLKRTRHSAAQALSWTFCAVIGLSLASIFPSPQGQALRGPFFAAASVLGATSFYG
jgi:hypothetical protein